MKESKKVQDQKNRDENRDPITGAPGSHTVGTGVGAASGGAAGAAIGTAVGGPVGAGVGIVAGAVIGGLAGKGAAEAIDPTAEDAYWRENYSNRDYVESGSTYETYRPAYRVGYEGYSRYHGRQYEEVEPDLRRDYERTAGPTGLRWEKARHAARDAWGRLENLPPSNAASDPARQPGTSEKTGTTGSGSGQSGCGCS
jgi:hypothetical protein